MPKDYLTKARTDIRYSKRAQGEEWILEFIEEAPMGYLATVYDGQPFINSNLFVYDADKHCIYMHTAQVGRTRSNVDQNPNVCFTATTMGRLLPADEALEFSVEYSGVVVFGTSQIIEDNDEKRYGLQILLDKYAPHLKPDRDYRGITDEELKRTAVYRIDIEEWSGKRKSVADDFPGAFFYGKLPDSNN